MEFCDAILSLTACLFVSSSICVWISGVLVFACGGSFVTLGVSFALSGRISICVAYYNTAIDYNNCDMLKL